MVNATDVLILPPDSRWSLEAKRRQGIAVGQTISVVLFLKEFLKLVVSHVERVSY